MFQDKKIYLRPIIPEDISEIFRWMNNPKVAYFNGIPFRFNSPQEIKDYYLRVSNNKSKSYKLMFCSEESNAIGIIEYKHSKPIFTGVEIELIIGNTELEEIFDISSSAIDLVCKYIFFELGYERIKISIANNLIKLVPYLENLGFVEEGLLREERLVDGEYIDLVCMGLLKEEYQKI